MRKIFLLIFILNACICHGQSYHSHLSCVANEKNNILFSGIENPVTILVQGISPANVIATASFGQLTHNIDAYYTFKTDSVAIVRITLQNKLKSDNWASVYEFKVQPLPDPQPNINGKTGGKISLAEISHWSAISSDSFRMEPRLPVISFRLSIVRNNDYIVKNIKNTGEHFNEEIQSALSKTEAGDSVIFQDILAMRKDKAITVLNTLSFLVIN